MRQPFWWLLILLVALAFAFQGTRGLWEPDEGRYTSTGINMLESGNWLLPTVDGEHPHLTKPPVTYWALAASFGLLGMNEWAARLPAALAFIGTGLLLLGLGRRLCPVRPWLPAVIYALSLAPYIGANVVSTDTLLTFFETAAMFAFVEAWHRNAALERRWIRAMWVLWGLAFMTKGPPGLIPLLAVVLLLAWQDRASLRRLLDPVGLAAFAVVAFTWFGILIAQEPDRLGYFLGYEVYDRIFTAKQDRNSGWYDWIEVYGPMFVVGALPWWVLALVAAGGPRAAWAAFRVRLRNRDRAWLLLAAWFFLPLTVFILARSRLQLYVLPLFVPLSLMLGRALGRWGWLTTRRLAWIAATTAVALVAFKGAIAHWPGDRDARQMARSIAQVVDTHGIEEIAFVGMRAFYGLSLYLDIHVEGVEFGEQTYPLSRHVAADDLCTELAERESNVYALKESRIGKFLSEVARCEGARPERIGDFTGDGNRIVLFRVAPLPVAPPGAE